MSEYATREVIRRRLEPIYHDLERESATTWDYSADQFLVVRLDGVKASGAFLKDHPRNLDYERGIDKAINTAYYMLRGWTKEENTNFYLGALSMSDEVSFILNSGTNWYSNRLLKLSTVLAGVLSAAMTKSFEIYQPERSVFTKKGHPDKRVLLNFDARPLIFDDLDKIVEYLRFRWILGCRNAMAKMLRLRGKMSEEDFSDPERWSNIEWMAGQLDEHGLFDAYRKATEGFRLYVPNRERKLVTCSIADTDDAAADRAFAMIKAYKRDIDG